MNAPGQKMDGGDFKPKAPGHRPNTSGRKPKGGVFNPTGGDSIQNRSNLRPNGPDYHLSLVNEKPVGSASADRLFEHHGSNRSAEADPTR
jgi:hypothetical protein